MNYINVNSLVWLYDVYVKIISYLKKCLHLFDFVSNFFPPIINWTVVINTDVLIKIKPVRFKGLIFTERFPPRINTLNIQSWNYFIISSNLNRKGLEKPVYLSQTTLVPMRIRTLLLLVCRFFRRPFLIDNLLALEEFLAALTVFIPTFLAVHTFNIRLCCEIIAYMYRRYHFVVMPYL